MNNSWYVPLVCIGSFATSFILIESFEFTKQFSPNEKYILYMVLSLLFIGIIYFMFFKMKPTCVHCGLYPQGDYRIIAIPGETGYVICENCRKKEESDYYHDLEIIEEYESP
ncbi:hypothetical protein UABAM_03055 [Candidatus Uabimicrobium amorphum]|uniref:Uncharacterized protein n=1 Tax=Uabimicrobium amorphum TaxID=2596890 RepID=A0A5S9F4P1_UABAM|nr:hypothetical protein UABAM_03055 [Candidatus Uabimicrobium amorphum]